MDGRFHLDRPIAHSATHMLFEANHIFTGQRVALKLLRPHLEDDEACRDALLREARALGRSEHRHVATLLDAAVDIDGHAYLAMELVKGRRLDGILSSRGRLPPEVATTIAFQLCAALERMHHAGVVHGSICAEHVLVGEDEERRPWCKLAGFGRATVTGEESQSRASRPSHPRDDLYAVSAILYESIVGVPPREESRFELSLDSQSGSNHVASPTHLGCPIDERLERVMLRALGDEAERFADARELRAALREHAPLDREPAAPQALRREHARAPYTTPIRLLLPGGGTVDARSEDISLGGMMIQIPVGSELPDAVEVRFARPGTGRVATVQATVQWKRPGGSSTAVGLAFRDLPSEIAQAIASFVMVMGAAGQPG